MAKITALRSSFIILPFLLVAMNQFASIYHPIFKMYDEFVWSSRVGIENLREDNGVNIATTSTPERPQHDKVNDPSGRIESSTITESKKDLSDRLLYDSVTNTALRSTSACIMFSDDNAWLPEWLAYHYYAAGLRTLVVHIDQTSVSGPYTVLNRWIQYFDNITIWDRRGLKIVNANTNNTESHTLRQTKFYKECALYLRNQSLPNQWTFFHDTDEFVTIDFDVVSDATERMAKPSSILRLLYDDRFNFARNVTKGVATSVDNEGNSSLVESTVTKTVRPRCHLLNRYLVTAEKCTREEIDEHIPFELKGTKLNTILYRNIHRKKKFHGLFKSLVDITHVRISDKARVHTVFKSLCRTKKGRRNPKGGQHPLIIKHYLGPFKLFHRENDNRPRSRSNWKVRSVNGRWQPSVIQPWLRGFVDHVGLAATQYLLQGAGIRNNTLA